MCKSGLPRPHFVRPRNDREYQKFIQKRKLKGMKSPRNDNN